METPTVSAKQKRKTLSAKKSKKQTIKAVLSTVYREYWPLLSDEDNEKLKQVLQENLPRIRLQTEKFPYKLIKNIPKSERKQFRFNYPTGSGKLVDKNEVSSIVLGINSVTISLEQDEIQAILVDDVKVLVLHIIDLAVLKSVPILVVRNLKYITKQFTGVPSTAIGFKFHNNDFNTFETKSCRIIESILNISKHYPIPPEHIHFHRSLNAATDLNTTKTNETQDTELNVSCEIVEITDNRDKNQNMTRNDNKNLYLRRENRKNRVFIPELSERKEEIRPDQMVADSSGFLALSPHVEETPKKSPTAKNRQNYRAMIIKRLKGDNNRTKRKLNNIKQKNNKKRK